jgi:hypothetical protein
VGSIKINCHTGNIFLKKKKKTSYKCCGIHQYVWVEGSGRKVAELKG